MEDNMKELKEQRVWMLWRWETRKDKPTKVPFSAHGGASGTSENWSNTWVTYVEAAEAVERNHAAGVGFKIPEGYYFIDIDDKPLDNPLVQTIFARHDSYAEYSVSGTGIHQYGKCDFQKIPHYYDEKENRNRLDRQYYSKNPHNDMELYIGGLTNRFAAFTGNVIVDRPLADCTTAILTTLEKDMRRCDKKKIQRTEGR